MPSIGAYGEEFVVFSPKAYNLGMPEPSITPFSTVFLFGIAQAIFLSFALLTASKGNRDANRYLAAMLLAFGLILLNEFLDHSLYGLNLIKFMIVCFPIDFLLGPLIWLYVSKMTGQKDALSRLPLALHAVPFIANEIAFIPKILAADAPDFFTQYPQLLEGNQIQSWITSTFFILFAVAQVAFYLVLSLRLLRKHSVNIGNQFSYVKGVGLRWLTKLLAVLFALYMLYVLEIVFARQFHLFNLEYADAILNLGVVATIYALGFYGIRQSSIFSRLEQYEQTVMPNIEPESEPQVPLEKDSHKKYSKSSLSAVEAEGLSEKLVGYMEEDKPYLDNELSLPKLANNISVSPNNLSQVINERFSLNFFDYVNSYRIEEAKHLLTSLDPKRVTILGVALDSGFNSKSAFYTAFKKHTSITPTQFRNQQKVSES